MHSLLYAMKYDKGRPHTQMPNRLRFGAIYRAFSFPVGLPPYPPRPLPLSSLTSTPSHFTLSLHKEANKKLSYRGQNAPSITITHERNSISEHRKIPKLTH